MSSHRNFREGQQNKLLLEPPLGVPDDYEQLVRANQRFQAALEQAIAARRTQAGGRSHGDIEEASAHQAFLGALSAFTSCGHDVAQTFAALCQEPTYAVQHKAPLFDYLVGSHKQRLRHGEAEHSGCLGIDDQLELR